MGSYNVVTWINCDHFYTTWHMVRQVDLLLLVAQPIAKASARFLFLRSVLVLKGSS